MRYKSVCELVNTQKLILRSNHYSTIINANANKPKVLWKEINHALFNKTSNNISINAIKLNNQMIQDKLAISKEFNYYFRDIGRELHDQIVNNYPTSSTLITVNSRVNSLYLIPTTDEEIRMHIDSLKPSNNIYDCISANSLKKHKRVLSPLLSKMINDCFMLGVFPNELKCSRIVPIFKSGDPHNMSNYRPISILPSLSKIMEKTIYNRLNSFFKRNGIIHVNQFGFQQQSCTLSATSTLINHIQKSIDTHKNNNTVCVFIDLKKAFDTVPHDLLINKLHKYGVRGNSNKLIQSYLDKRRQYVDINGSLSDVILNENNFSLPQGSNLGPFLFLVYINDIFSIKLNGMLILFADDAVLTYTHYDKSVLQSKIQEDINKIHEWLINNRLTLNADKTKYLLIKNHKNRIDDFKLNINHNDLERVETFKYLGVMIRDNLKWNTHVDIMCGRVQGLIGAFKRLGNKLHTSTKIALYHSMINSLLTYLLPVWGTSLNEVNLNKLQVVQNKALRAIFSYEYTHLNYNTSMIRSKYGLLSVRQLIRFACSVLMYKIENKYIKINYTIERNNAHPYPTRGRNTPILDTYRTNLGRLNIFRVCTSFYNDLNPIIKNATTLGMFMKNLKFELLNNTEG